MSRLIVTHLKTSGGSWTQYQSDDFPDECAVWELLPGATWIMRDGTVPVAWAFGRQPFPSPDEGNATRGPEGRQEDGPV